LAAAGAHAAIDVSDGLLADLGHLCEASGVGAEVRWDLLPRSQEVAALDAAGGEFAATGGEDYELLAACAIDLTDDDLQSLGAAAGVSFTVIGCCTASPGVQLLDAQGQPRLVRAAAGFDHFTPATDRGAR
jgi:thiamine-monophosphate kinase